MKDQDTKEIEQLLLRWKRRAAAYRALPGWRNHGTRLDAVNQCARELQAILHREKP